MDLTLGRAAWIAPAASSYLLAAISLVLLGSPAAAKAPPSGATSSASIEIRVSVAPRYRLKAIESPADQPSPIHGETGSFCIASNGTDMALPAELVLMPYGGQREGGGEVAANRAPVVSCHAPRPFRGLAQGPDQLRAVHMVIVRPE